MHRFTVTMAASDVLLMGMMMYCLVTVSCSANHEDVNVLYQWFKKQAANFSDATLPLETEDTQKLFGSNFSCPPSVSPTVPTSVHFLRPGDLKVIGAMGDSLTASYGSGASTYTVVMFDYVGQSASVGGDRTLDKIITLPNIFQKYNSHLYGYSSGVAVPAFSSPFKRLNVAEDGSTAINMPDQARKLIAKMKGDTRIDFENDWKFITLFIGGNDLCSGCVFPSESSPQAFIKYVEQTIQILHDESPRTFLNVLSVPTANQIVKLRGPLKCSLIDGLFCPCVLGGSLAQQFMYLKSREFQRLLRESIESGKFDGKEDFTAVYQPFLEDAEVPTLPDGEPDRSFFAPDCFHLSQKGQAFQATCNWNNLLQPVGSKTRQYFPGVQLNCPSEEFPYLYTNVNSQPGFKNNAWRPKTNEE